VEGLRAFPDRLASDGAPDAPSVLVAAVAGSRTPVLRRLEAAKLACPTISVIALAGPETAGGLLPLVEAGVLDQVADPGNPAAVYSAVKAGAAGAALARQAGEAARNLRRLKKEHTSDLRRAMEIEEVFESTLENFMAALDIRDVETFGHSRTVARYSHVLAEALGIRDQKTLDNIRRGALLHDAGKIAIPDAILKKPGPLTPQEWDKIRRHPALGYGLVKDVKLLKEVGNIILCHHERYDGTGYPRGLRDGAIPLEARIFAVADTLDAITSHRPYRGPKDFGAAKTEIARNAGTQFDPGVVAAFAAMDVRVWEKIRFETTRLVPAVDAFRRAASRR
jgi:cyclic di-GMP phosphodiesterase